MPYNNQIGSGWAAACFLGGIIAIMSCSTNVASADTLHVPGDYATIQDAINAANAGGGDEIIVGPGTYNETINFNGKPVHLRSSDGPEVTIIDATGIGGSVVTCASGEGPDTILDGFTITGGTGTVLIPGASVGGGMLIRWSSPAVVDCVFAGNSAGIGGGIGYSEGSSPAVIGCTFIGNTAGSGGGIGERSQINWSNELIVTNSVFIGNTGDAGGAMYLVGNSDVTDCTFNGNTAYRGGAIHAFGASTFASCSFVQNSAIQAVAEDGGGAVYNQGSSPTFTDCQFTQNHVEIMFLYTGGGAVRNQSGSNPTFVNCTFEGNTAFGSDISGGGAVANSDNSHATFAGCTFTNNQADWDGAMYSELGSGVTMDNCVFEGNAAVNGGSGGFGSYWGGDSSIVNCLFVNNSATGGGGGLFLQDSAATIVNSTFSGNMSDVAGGGVLTTADAQATFINCLFESNAATLNGGGLQINNGSQAIIINSTISQNTGLNGGGIRLGPAATATVQNSIVWNNSAGQISAIANAGPVSVTYSNVQGGFAGAGNINANPLFVEAANGDFRLSAGSPSIDAGDNFAVPDGITTDLDGNPRIVPGVEGGEAIVDMGPYEFQVPPAPACPADLTGNGSVGVPDLLALLACWGPVDPGPGNECAAADLTGNNNVGVPDLLYLLSQWGPCP